MEEWQRVKRTNARRRWGIPILLIGVGVFAYAISRAGASDVWSAVIAARWRLVTLGVLATVVSTLLRSGKWHLIMRSQGWVSDVRESLGIYGSAAVAGFVTPARGGEIVGPIALRSLRDVPFGRGVAMLVADRLLEGLLLAVLAALGAFRLSGILPATWGRTMLVVGIGAGIATAVLAGVVFSTDLVARTAGRLSEGRSGLVGALLMKIERFATDMRLARSILAPSGLLWPLLLLTCLAWGTDFLGLFAISYAMQYVALIDSASAQAVTAAAGLLSLVPGGIGVTTLAFAEFMRLLGYSLTAMTAAAALNPVIRVLVNLTVAGIGARAISHRRTADDDG